MRKIYLFVLIVFLGVNAKAQYINMVANSAEGDKGTDPSDIIAIGHQLVYSGNYNFYSFYRLFFGVETLETSSDYEMFIYDVKTDSTIVHDIDTSRVEKTDSRGNTYYSYNSSYFDNPVVYKDMLYFEADNGTEDGIYTYDPLTGTYAFWMEGVLNTPQVHNDTLYYCLGGNAPIVRFDGTVVDTFAAMDTLLDVYSYGFTKLGSKFIVSAEDLKTKEGREPYLYDPAYPDSILKLADIATGTGSYDDSNPKFLTNVGDKVYFQAYHYKGTASGSNALIFWETDGTPEGTVAVDALNSMTDSLYNEVLFVDGDMLYVSASVGGDKYNRQIFSYNTSTGIATQITNAAKDHYPSDMVKLDGTLYYSGSVNYKYHLHKIEGSTVSVVDSVVFDVENLTVLNGKLYFGGNMMLQSEEGGFVETGVELMVYDPNNTVGVNPYLSDLTLADTTIDGFDTYTGSYEVILPVGGTAAVVAGTPADTAADVTVTQTTTVPGTASIEVVAADGVTTRVYTVNFREVSTDATLTELNVADSLIDGFDPMVTSYEIKITSDSMEIPEIAGIAADMNAVVTVVQADTLPGVATVTVVAEDGSTEMVYMINFVEKLTGVNDLVESQFKVYPTVTNQYFTVDLGTHNSARVSVFSLTGQMIMDKQYNQAQAQIHIEKAGIYLIRVANESEMRTFKVIKQ
ncbi:T9SS type A sorting domain-containing protein [Maribellus sediminis]|uniref:T9SS type A sorting domain-containing protein n=1 Tax=Maribellus sediminis TaxID=2696285 RepID=UPI00142F60A1|nr:T9SS type A sorting domain-containing protein [Maribellus sediminis]